MCLIIGKPKGTEITHHLWSSIRNASHSNSNGMGYMFKLEGEEEIFIHKGFFDPEDLIRILKEQDLKKNDELVVHLRYTTSGETNVANCHPFVVSSIESEVLANGVFVSKPCIVHNGVIKKFERANSVFSDTFHFTKDFLSRIDDPLILKNPKLVRRYNNTLEEVLKGFNKFAVLSPTRDLSLFGNFNTSDGYYYSNRAWESNSAYSRMGHSKNSNSYYKRPYNKGHYLDKDLDWGMYD